MLLLRFKTFTKSLYFHISNGFPKATNSQIMDRYKICLDCENFDQNKSICNICGCALSTKSKFLNKLAWADQECPVGKWSKLL